MKFNLKDLIKAFTWKSIGYNLKIRFFDFSKSKLERKKTRNLYISSLMVNPSMLSLDAL